jgi:hypothetical protein
MTQDKVTFLPSEEWRERFEEQATKTMLDKLHRAARTRLRTFAGRSGHVNRDDVEDVVMSVLRDTLCCVLRWDPDKETLEHHALDAIRFRVRDRWQKELRRKHDLLDEDEHDRSVSEHAAAGAIVPASLVADDRERRIQEARDEVVAWLRPRCLDKPEVLELLEIYLNGVTEREEVMRDTGMSESTYHNARRRLGRLVQDMPVKLRAAALDALN